MSDKTMKIILDNGSIEEVEVLFTFELLDVQKQYVVYTKNEVDESGNVTIYISTIVNSDGGVKLTNIATEEEWNKIKDVLRLLTKDE